MLYVRLFECEKAWWVAIIAVGANVTRKRVDGDAGVLR